MKTPKVQLCCLLTATVLLVPALACAQSALPQSKTWTFKDIITNDQYADPPFREIAQGRDGLVYVTDEIGILEFDGINWRRLPLPESRTATSLGFTDTGELIVGGMESLLEVTQSVDGLKFRDLAELVPGGTVGIGQIWDIAAVPGRWCVRAEPRLICKDSEGYFTVPAHNRFGRLLTVHKELLVREEEHGLFRLDGRTLVPVKGGEFYSDRRLNALVPFGTHGMAGFSRDPFEVAVWTDLTVAPIPAKVDVAATHKGKIGVASVLADGSYALPFVNGDLVLLDRHWNEIARFQASQFGATPGASSVSVDREGGIWVAWSNAITHIAWPLRVSLYREEQGIQETPSGVIERGAEIIAVTGNTYSVLKADDTRSTFTRAPPNFGWIHNAALLGDELLLLTDKGVLDSKGNPLPLPPALARRETVSHFNDPAKPDEVLIGLRFGLARIHRASPTKLETEVRDGINFDVLDIITDADDAIWMTSGRNRVARLVPKPGSRALADAQLIEFDAADGLPTGDLELGRIGDEILVGSLNGFVRFSNGRFQPNARLAFEETGPVAHFLVLNSNELLVANAAGRLRLLAKNVAGVYTRQKSVFDGIAGFGNIQSMMIDRNGIVWLSTDSGVVRVDPSVGQLVDNPMQVLVREVSSNGHTLYSGHGRIPPLSFAEGDSVRFDYALPSFHAAEFNTYRSRIRAVDGSVDWSPWSKDARRDFTNLPAGGLVFEVEARDATGASSGNASVPITVVGPWYRRTSTQVGFWLAGLALIAIGVQWRLRALRKRSRQLEKLVAQKTEALRLAAATDPLTGLWNRHRFGQWLREDLPAITEHAMHAGDNDAAEVIVCAIDLDHFKHINDRHGHAAGDAVLAAVAERLRAIKREGDLIFRFGGEEFIYLGLNRRRSEGHELARRIVETVRQTSIELDNGVRLDPTASVGWSAYPFYRQRADLFSMDFVLGVADRALYAAKASNRDCAIGHLPNLDVDEIDRTQVNWRTQVFERHPDLLRQV